MKKILFVFAVSAFVATSCNMKPAQAEETTVEETAVVTETAVVDSTAKACCETDSVKACCDKDSLKVEEVAEVVAE